MTIIKTYRHPDISGTVYLWENGDMNYSLGTATKTFMKFDGWFLDEIEPKIAAKGFIEQ